MNMFDALYESISSDEIARISMTDLLSKQEPTSLISPGVRNYINSILVKPITQRVKDEMEKREAIQYERGLEHGKNQAFLEAYEQMEEKKEKEITELKERIRVLEQK